MIYLVDTNILLPFVDSANLSHSIVRSAARQLRANGHQLHTTLQNFAEFWNVSTRDAGRRGGFGRTPLQTDLLLHELELLFPLLLDSPGVYPEWRRLVVNYSVSGVQVHDARLVAAMIVHGVTHILTFNTRDFTRYEPAGIIAIDPAAV